MGTTISGDTGVVFPDATTQSTAVTVATPFSINASAGAGAQLRLPEATANGVNYVAVKAADALSSNVTFTLPTADGTSGQVLQTNGAGQLSFGSVSPGGTTGQVQINNAGAFGAISSGTSGQVLTSNGAGVAPSFATPSGGFSNYVVFTSSGSWTAPAGITKALVTVVGGGGGGTTGSGTGGTTSFVGPTTTSATGGAGGSAGAGPGAGGVGSGGDLNGRGGNGLSNGSGPYGWGGASIYSLASDNYNTSGVLGAGGGGNVSGQGGGGGGHAIKMYTGLVPGTAYTVTIGAGGAAGGSGFAGGSGVVTIMF